MKKSTPKQFLLLNKKPILLHSLQKFSKAYKNIKLIIVLPKQHISVWKKICDNYSVNIKHTIVSGGKTRFHSVKNALNLLEDKNGLVAIHDAVRPFLSNALIKKTFIESRKKLCAIPVINLNSSVRKVSKNKNTNIERNTLKLVQTPQCFSLTLIKKAYKQKYIPSFTDDATVLERLGYNVNLIKGDENNFKITYPYDIERAESLYQSLYG